MATLPPGARAVDPSAEADRWAEKRLHPPEKVLHAGDTIRVYDSDGTVFTGRILGVNTDIIPRATRRGFGVICGPAEEDPGA